MMLGPLATTKEPTKTRTLMCWLPEKIKDIVRTAEKVTENNYSKVTEFLLSWAKPKTTMYNKFKVLKGLSQGSMNFEQFAATIQKLVNDCNIQNTQVKDSIIRNFIVTGANSETAYRRCVEAGPDASLERIIEIYRNEAAVQAHFQTGTSSQPIVHQVNTELNSSKEGEEDIPESPGDYSKTSSIWISEIKCDRERDTKGNVVTIKLIVEEESYNQPTFSSREIKNKYKDYIFLIDNPEAEFPTYSRTNICIAFVSPRLEEERNKSHSKIDVANYWMLVSFRNVSLTPPCSCATKAAYKAYLKEQDRLYAE